MVVPKKILSLVDLTGGSEVLVSVENDRLVVTPKRKPRYTLAQLLSRCRRSDFKARPKDRQWLETGPVGREAL